MSKKDMDLDFVEVKSTNIADRMNELTKNFDLSISAVKELTTKGSDFEDLVQDVLQKTDEKHDAPMTIEETGAKIEVNMVVEDFLFVRQSLKENTRNAKIILERLTYEIAD